MVKPRCKLTGEDGTVVSIIGLVSRALQKAGQPERAKEFQGKAIGSGSYDQVLAFCGQYVEVV